MSMKIRTGFVSNSSSSNFVVDNTYETVFDLAKAMLKIRNNDYKDMSSYDQTKCLTEIDDINRAIRDDRDPDISIYFTTCNYDTYIKKVEIFYIVATCNNHPFIHDLKGIKPCPDKIKEWSIKKDYLNNYSSFFNFTEDLQEHAMPEVYPDSKPE